jgi:hypothetical protein
MGLTNFGFRFPLLDRYLVRTRYDDMVALHGGWPGNQMSRKKETKKAGRRIDVNEPSSKTCQYSLSRDLLSGDILGFDSSSSASDHNQLHHRSALSRDSGGLVLPFSIPERGWGRAR